MGAMLAAAICLRLNNRHTERTSSFAAVSGITLLAVLPRNAAKGGHRHEGS